MGAASEFEMAGACVESSRPDGSPSAVAPVVGERYPDLRQFAAQTRPFDVDPVPVTQARQSGPGRRMSSRVAIDGTPWCLTCNTVLSSRRQTFCGTCQREYDAQRKRLDHGLDASEQPVVTLLEADAHAIHDATEYVSDAAWTLRVLLDANVPPSEKMQRIENRADALVIAIKDLVWYVTTHVPDNRPQDERNTDWRRHLPLPRPEPDEM